MPEITKNKPDCNVRKISYWNEISRLGGSAPEGLFTVVQLFLLPCHQKSAA
jgi:hypothetical protein